MSLFCSLENPIKCLYLPIDLVEVVEYYITGMMDKVYNIHGEDVLSSKNRYVIPLPYKARSSTSHYFSLPRGPKALLPVRRISRIPVFAPLPFSGSGRRVA